MHYWSPALVGFIGWGGGGLGFGLGFGFGNIGWVPLAPYEVFHPWWGASYYGRPGFINRNLNIASGNINNVYRNAGVLNGVTAVRGADFQAGRFGNMSHFNGSQIGSASVVRGGVPMAPSAANLRFSDRAVASTPRTSANTQFFSRQQSSTAAQRIPFAQQQRAFEQAGMPVRGGVAGATPGARGATAVPNGLRQGVGVPAQGGMRQGVTPSTAPRISPSSAAQSTQPSGNQAAQPAPQNRGGWQRFGDPGARTAQPGVVGSQGQAAPQQPGNGGWSRFGNPQADRPQQQPQQQNRIQPAPSYNAPRYSAPAPQPSAPRYSAPAPAPRSAPASPSRGGGGGSHGRR